MSNASHIPLDSRKILSGRLVFIESAEQFEHLFLQQDKQNGPVAFDKFRRGYFDELTQQVTTQPPNTQLDDFLIQTLADYKPFAELHLKAYPALFQQVWDALEKRALGVSCTKCTQACKLQPTVCDDTKSPYNNELVEKGGLCITSLMEMYKAAHKVTELLYSHYLPAAHTYPPVVFSTIHYANPEQLHHLPIRYFVRGETQFHGRGNISSIELGLTPRVFDVATFTATPYILFHECIAHAFFSISPACAGRTGVGDSDEFSEGWMDLVAFKVAEEVLSDSKRWHNLIPLPNTPQTQSELRQVDDLVSSLKGKIRNTTAFVDAGNEYHLARHLNPRQHLTLLELAAGITVNKYVIRAMRLKEGVEAANKFLIFLKTQFGIVRTLPLFLRISFELNTLNNFNEARRVTFVTLMNDLPLDGEISQPRHEEIYRIIRNYLEQGEIGEFMESCYVLKSRLAQISL